MEGSTKADLRKALRDMEERVKELECIYGVSEVIRKGDSLDSIFRRVVSLIPPSWHYPEITRARIRFENSEFVSEPFEKTQWSQSSDIVCEGEKKGSVEVFYTEERPQLDEGPFLQEERNLLDGIARSLAEAEARKRAERRQRHLEALLRSIRNVNQLIVHEKNRERLIQSACQNLTSVQGFDGAWIILIDRLPDKIQSGQSGFDNHAFDPMAKLVRDGWLPPCCHQADEQGEVVCTHNPGSKCGNCPLRSFYGGNVAMTSALRYGKWFYGYLSVSIPDEFADIEEESDLLAEIAGDIAFALRGIEEEDEHRQKDRKLSSARKFLDTVVDMSPFPLWVSNPEGTVVRTNRALCETLTLTDDQITGKYNVFNDANLSNAGVMPDVKAVFEERRPARFELHWKTGQVSNVDFKGGRDLFIKVALFPIVDVTGKLTHVVCQWSDITAHKQTEADLQKNEQKYRFLVENTKDIAYSTDAEGKLTFLGPQAMRYGIDPEKAIGRNLLELVAPEDSEYIAERFQRSMTDGDENPTEFRIVDQQGKIYWFEEKGSVIYDQSGNIIGISGTLRDITERKEAETERARSCKELESAVERLKRAQKQLVQQERMNALGQMASGVAHDFNNVLMPIAGFTEILLSDPESLDNRKEALHMLKMINNATEDARQIVRRLRHVYKDVETEYDLLDLRKVLESSVSLTMPMWKKQMRAEGKNINIGTEFEDIPPVNGSASELREMFTNLILNSIDAMPEGGTITLRLMPVGTYAVACEVVDTGKGMDSQTVQRCLEPFYTSKGTQGTGLGLPLVQGIAERHDGNIFVESAPGQGTTVRIILPAARNTEEATSGEQAEPDPLPPLRALVIDDEARSRDLIQTVLETDGHDVAIACETQKGIDMFRNGDFDIVITDRAMPDISGDVVAKTVTEEKAGNTSHHAHRIWRHHERQERNPAGSHPDHDQANYTDRPSSCHAKSYKRL